MRLISGQIQYDADADRGVLDGVHTGATWRIRLNRPCAAKRPYCKITLTTCYCISHGRSAVYSWSTFNLNDSTLERFCCIVI